MANGIFICGRCKKEKSKCFAYGITYTGWHDNKACPDCGKIKQRGVSIVEGMCDKMKRIYVGCLDCNPVMDDDENIWFTDRVCVQCFLECKKQTKNDVGITKNSSLFTDLQKENQELRQQLAAVQKQLAEVLAELKKLKNNSTGKDSEKLNQQIVQNERLITSGSAVSEVEVQDQINKSEALMKEFNTTVSPVNDNKKDNGSLPYVIGGSVILVSAGIIGYFLLKKNKRK